MKRNKFIIELKNQLNNNDFMYLRNLYLPIIGTKATMLYQLLYDHYEIHQNHNSYFEFNNIAKMLAIPESELILIRKRLEAIGLIRVFVKSDDEHFIIKINKPLSPLEFKNNSLLYKDFINKQGEIMFERVYFAIKGKEYAKDEFAEITTKYQALFTINKSEKIRNTQVIELPTIKNIESAKKGLTSEQFIYYLTSRRPSPLQSNTITKIKNLGLCSMSINEILSYSYTINNKVIVSSHVLSIAQDLYSKDITNHTKIAVELTNAKHSRLKTPIKNNSQKNNVVRNEDWESFFDLLGDN